MTPNPNSFFFVYGSTPKHLPAGKSVTNSIHIMRGVGDFLCKGIWVSCKNPLLIQIRGQYHDRNWFNQPLHSDLISQKLPEPILVPECTTVVVEFSNLIEPSDLIPKEMNVVTQQMLHNLQTGRLAGLPTQLMEKDNSVSIGLVGLHLGRSLDNAEPVEFHSRRHDPEAGYYYK